MLRTTGLVALCALSLLAPAAAQDKGELKKVAQAAWADQDWKKASTALSKLCELAPDDARAWYQLGYALHAQNRLDEALKAHIKAASFKGSPTVQPATYNVACVHALQGRKDQAFEWLNKAVDVGFTNEEQFHIDSDMDNLRKDSRFKKLLARVKEAASSQPIKVFNYTSPRYSTRATYFAGQGRKLPGQLSIDYGAPKWRDSFSEKIADDKFIGRRWRLGADAWTTLDTNVAIELGGVKFEPGHYYLTVTHKGDMQFALNVLEPKVVRKYRLDPYLAHLAQGGTDVAMKYKKVDEVSDKLKIAIKVDKQKQSKGRVVVHFGPHVLVTSLKVHLVR